MLVAYALRMSLYLRSVGADGESIALMHYLKKGYRLLARNIHSRFGELDLVLEKENTVVFVEVKTRSNTDKGMPYEAVNLRKLVSLKRNMQFYLLKRDLIKRKCKLIVCSILLATDKSTKILKDYEIVL